MLDWENLTIAKALKEASEKWGNREGLVSKNERLTYSELYKKSCQLAWGFTNLGIKKGDHVATIFGAAPEWVIAKYALHIIGAVIIPVNVNFKAKEIEFILKQADVSTIITVDKLRTGNYIEILDEVDREILVTSNEKKIQSKTFPLLQRIICFSPGKNRFPFCYDFYDIMDSGRNYSEEEIKGLIEIGRSEDICNILFTSGSTAFPKGVVHMHKSLLGIGACLLGKTFNLEPVHRLLCNFPFYHIAGCVYFVLGALTSGCALHVNEFVPDEVLHILQNEKINLFCGFDYHFNSLANHKKFHDYNLRSVSRILLAVGPEWYDKCKKVFPGAEIIAHHYGFTEGTGISVPLSESDYEIRKNTNGRPWPGIEVKVVDPITGNKVSAGESGELCLRGWSRFQKYYKNHEETKKSIDSGGFFHSGDYGWMDEKGNVTYRGRYKMMIKTGGENVSEREVEVFLETIPGIKTVAVIGIPDPKWGESVTAIIEAEPGADLTKEKIAEFCKNKISRFKIPKNVLMMDGQDWPVLGSGKLDKNKIKEWARKKLDLN
jgi:fatty-acyl-CoA synthase